MKIILPSGQDIDVSPGTSFLEGLQSEGIYLTSSCGGKGTCGKCRIVIKSGDVRSDSRMKITREEAEKGYVLACQSYPTGDVRIDIPKESSLTVEGKVATGKSRDLIELLRSMETEVSPITKRIVLDLPRPSLDDNISDLDRLKRAITAEGLGCLNVPFRTLEDLSATLRREDWKVTLCIIHGDGCYEITNVFPGDRRIPRYGIAIDIGTTTLVVYLIDMTEGGLIDVASTYNSQIRFGDDVITRIVHATEYSRLADLHGTVIDDINLMLAPILQNHGISIDLIDNIVIAGNPTMTHLFFGFNPRTIREEPYVLTAGSFPLSFAGELGLELNPRTPLYTLPSVASYLGGDIVAGVLVSGIHAREELCFFMDIGTNGEMVLGNAEFLIAAACSAGPCFEGSGIKNGMRATEGAIEGVRIDRDTGEPEIRVIGDIVPMGICGSGMIDAISEMFLSGVIDQKGVLQKDASKRIREGEDGLEYIFYSYADREIVLTMPDLENIIRAKAAVYAGFTTLLKETGFSFQDIHRVYIAGGFGNYLDVEKAIVLGMLPDMPRERYEFLGNTSIKGAYLCTLSQQMRETAEEIAQKMTCVELSVSKLFMDEFVSGIFIPHTHTDDFPSVKEKMKKRSSI